MPRQVSFDVPRRVTWYVTQHLTPEETETYWLICCLFDRLKSADRSYRITAVAFFMMFVMSLPLLGFHPWLGAPLVIGAVLVLAMHHYRRACCDRLEHVIGDDEEKWETFGRPVVEMYNEYEPGDPTETVTVTLPDD